METPGQNDPPGQLESKPTPFLGGKFWPLFFALMMAPAVFTFLAQSIRMEDTSVFSAIYGSGGSAILCGTGLALRITQRIELRVLFSLVFIPLFYGFCFFTSMMACNAFGSSSFAR